MFPISIRDWKALVFLMMIAWMVRKAVYLEPDRISHHEQHVTSLKKYSSKPAFFQPRSSRASRGIVGNMDTPDGKAGVRKSDEEVKSIVRTNWTRAGGGQQRFYEYCATN